MYTIKRHLMSILVIGALAISAFFVTNAEASNTKTGTEIAGISVRFGGGYGHGGRYWGRGRHWGHGPGWGYGYRRNWRGYYGPRYYRYNYYDPYNYYYGPGGVYLNWRR